MKNYCVGIDIGGTTVKCGLFKSDGALVDKWEVVTRKEEGGKYILPDVATSLKEKLASLNLTNADLLGIGMGVPGPVLPDNSVEICVNLGWKDINPATVMKELMGGDVECLAGNDANVAALGEMWQGGGKGYSNVVAITLGTGVGAGVIVDGKMIPGVHGLGGEVGHLHVRDEETEYCNCGGRGCLEQVASATGIAREARRNMAAKTTPSTMRQFGDAIGAKNVCDCAKEGDELALETIRTSCKYLGIGLSAITHIVNPEVYVIGGGVSKAGTFLTDLIQEYFNEYTTITKHKAKIELAKLGNDAGIYGAARLVLDLQ